MQPLRNYQNKGPWCVWGAILFSSLFNRKYGKKEKRRLRRKREARTFFFLFGLVHAVSLHFFTADPDHPAEGPSLSLSKLMSQQSKAWIQQRMSLLKKQGGFAFNQDLFISILLCLVSGKDRHIIFTAPSQHLPALSQMATLVCFLHEEHSVPAFIIYINETNKRTRYIY